MVTQTCSEHHQFLRVASEQIIDEANAICELIHVDVSRETLSPSIRKRIVLRSESGGSNTKFYLLVGGCAAAHSANVIPKEIHKAKFYWLTLKDISPTSIHRF